MSDPNQQKWSAWASGGARLYFLLLFAWLVLYLIFGDGNGYLGLANALALYFFVPLPLLAFIAILTRQKRLLWPLLLSTFALAWFWGPLFLPKVKEEIGGPRLRVMSYNILGRAGDNQPILDSILAEDADVLFLQEVTPQIAAVFSVRLAADYPFQIMQPASQARGMGVLSRYPIEEMDISISGSWMGSPQILRMDWEGHAITLVNFHTHPTATLWPPMVLRTFEQREEDLQALADFAAQQSVSNPLIVAGDANVTHLNDAYRSLAAVLKDAWWQAGRGLGHTFPGAIDEDSAFAQVSIFRIPLWLVRIDYVFFSDHWQASKAWLADFNGGSDHRGVVTDLILAE